MSTVATPGARRVTEIDGESTAEAVAEAGSSTVGGPYYTIENADGSIVLVPVAEVHPEERVFFEDAEVRESILRGMINYENGDIVRRDDFFLDSDDE